MEDQKRLTEQQIREKLYDYCSYASDCGLEAFVVKKSTPRLKRMSLSEKRNEDGKDFRTILKEMFFSIIEEQYLSQEAEYADGSQVADNQHKYLIFEQREQFQPFAFLNEGAAEDFAVGDLDDASGLAFKIRKGNETIWLYQHLWGMMIPNKKRTNLMARLSRFENQIVFSEQTEKLLTIARKIDIVVINDNLITNNLMLLQRSFGFQDYINQSAKRVIQTIIGKEIVQNTDKLYEYIERGNGKPRYAKKMMRIGSSRVFNLTKEQLFSKINTIERWQGKFKIDESTECMMLATYMDVENLIDLLDERFTRSDVTNTEYDTDVKRVAGAVAEG